MKFQKTFCSQCGGEFGPGNSGYSHCINHTKTDQKTDHQNWYDDIPEEGVLCGVASNNQKSADQHAESSEEKIQIYGTMLLRGKRIFVSHSTVWRYATPVTR